MNSWLQFTSHTVSRAFEAHSAKSFASKSSSMLTASFLAQFSYLILQVIHLSLAEHETAYDYHFYTAICVLIFCIASIIGFMLHRKYPFLDNYSTYTVGLPALLNLVGVYELFMALGLKDTERRTIEFGLVYFQIFLSVTLLSIPKIWYQKSVLAFGCSVYMLVRKADSYTVQLGLTNSFLCLMITIALTLGFYKFERHDKMSFIDHHKATTQEKILTNLLDGLPEGILVVDKAKKVYYCNHAMHVVLDTDENHEEIFEKIQDLHIDQIVDEIEKLEDMTLFDGFSGHFFNGPSPRRKHYSESPEKTLEADSPGLEPIIKRRARAGNTMENLRLSKLFNGKNSFHNSQEYEKTRVNVSTTLGSPMKKNSDLGKRLREESVHSADLLAVAPKRSAYKKGSSGYFPLETHFRMDFDDEKFKGYAGNPVSALDYKLFNLHGKYLRKCKDMLTENEWQQCAYEVKVREMEIDDQLFKVFIISDISIREKLANLEENSKFKNLMFASLSHEFRTPLNGIYSMLEVATKQVKDTSVVKNYLTPAFVNTHLLLHLVNDMLDYSMVMAGKLLLSLKKFSLHDCLKEVLDLIEPQALLKNLDLSLKISSSIPKKIRSDKVRVQQVLVNLLNNATKFTSKGSIEIKIEQDPTRGHLLRVSVEDTGVGISESDISKLNRLISQLDVTEKISHNSTGIGMGLMMSQALALALGPPGEESTGIQIDSEYGKGSVFKFTVYNHDSVGTLEDVGSFPTLPDERSPRSHNRTDFLTTIFNPKQGIKHIHNIGKKKSQRNVILQKSQQQQQPPQIFECQCPKVLVVDDTAYNILALQTQLSAMGVVSDVAYNGQEAVNKICDEYKKRSSCCQGYKLVLMDCNMPVLDGYEATRKIRIKLERKELAPLTVIGCTAYTDKALLDQGLQCGMEDCITKPIKAKDLKKFLEDYGVTKKSQDLIKS